ncbi:disks large-associated protein 5-like [Dendronephthya gigantea]|uniref:disks large-associated protein 5-like n=1 Tax=Dendronephthya gigantea TaxID=151771 RepID=UPI00106C47A2|nr:disks large-associated protein 5-like [Dendronephthya gigantea]
MASTSLKTPRQLMMKCTKQKRQVDRETRAFVALQSRKISRRNDIEKKRGIPSIELPSDENKAQNCQEQIKTEEGFTKIKKPADPIKEALKKWQKEKRLRQIKEKNTKKQPFRISHVSHQLSEFSHSFQNDQANQTNKTKKSKSKNVSVSQAAQKKNYSSTKEGKVSSSLKETNNKGTNNTTKPYPTRSSSRAMKTRSMARMAATLTNNAASIPVSMETDDIHTSQPPSCTRNLPGCVTRSRSNIDERQPVHPMNDHGPASIPNDFSFNVPVGVKSFVFCGDKFKFTPLSPNSAKKFFPTRTPVREQRDDMKQKLEIGSSKKRNGAPVGMDVCDSVSADITTADVQNTSDKASIEGAVLDTKYFRNMANSEIDRLKSCCAHWETVQEEMIPEEVKGKLRTVIGQVQLLVTKKFKQFSGLLDLSEDTTAKKKALVSDLQGFWEMMYLQVEDIDKKFAELEEIKKNNWEEKKVEVKKKNVKRIAKAKRSASKTANPKVSESRNKFREMRAQMKAKLEANNNEEQDAFKIILTPMKNKKANADPSVPEIVLTPVRRSTRKSRGCATITIPLVNLPSNVSVDLFGACKTPELIQKNADNFSNLDDDIFLSRKTTPVTQSILPEGDLMSFTPTTPAKRV